MKLKLSLFLLLFFSAAVFADVDNHAAANTNAKLGLAYLQKGYYSMAKEHFLLAIQEDPNAAAPWYSMAYYLEKTGNVDEAQKYYQKAIDVNLHSGAAKN